MPKGTGAVSPKGDTTRHDKVQKFREVAIEQSRLLTLKCWTMLANALCVPLGIGQLEINSTPVCCQKMATDDLWILLMRPAVERIHDDARVAHPSFSVVKAIAFETEVTH